VALHDDILLEPPGGHLRPHRGPLVPVGDLHQLPPRPPREQVEDRPAQHRVELVSEATGSPRATRRRPLGLQGILRGGELVASYEGTPWPTMLSSAADVSLGEAHPWPVVCLLPDEGIELRGDGEGIPGASVQPSATPAQLD